VLFEKGISLQRENKYAWHYTSALSPQYAVSPDGVPSGFQVWPLVAIESWGNAPCVGLVLPATRGVGYWIFIDPNSPGTFRTVCPT
jgi:hypothetical protein